MDPLLNWVVVRNIVVTITIPLLLLLLATTTTSVSAFYCGTVVLVLLKTSFITVK